MNNDDERCWRKKQQNRVGTTHTFNPWIGCQEVFKGLLVAANMVRLALR